MLVTMTKTISRLQQRVDEMTSITSSSSHHDEDRVPRWSLMSTDSSTRSMLPADLSSDSSTLLDVSEMEPGAHKMVHPSKRCCRNITPRSNDGDMRLTHHLSLVESRSQSDKGSNVSRSSASTETGTSQSQCGKGSRFDYSMPGAMNTNHMHRGQASKAKVPSNPKVSFQNTHTRLPMVKPVTQNSRMKVPFYLVLHECDNSKANLVCKNCFSHHFKQEGNMRHQCDPGLKQREKSVTSNRRKRNSVCESMASSYASQKHEHEAKLQTLLDSADSTDV